MAETIDKLPVKRQEEGKVQSWAPQAWHPVENLRRAIDSLFEDFDRGAHFLPWRRSIFDIDPFRRREEFSTAVPAMDFVETDKSYEITAELPGLDEKDIEVRLANGCLTIHGEKHEEKEKTKKGYYLNERHFGSFERMICMPDGVDTEKIEATFKKGVLSVMLPKTSEAQKAEKRIAIKAG